MANPISRYFSQRKLKNLVLDLAATEPLKGSLIITREMSVLLIVLGSMILLSAGQNASPNPSPTEQRIFLAGGEVKALSNAYSAFLMSKETGGGNVPLGDLLVDIRHLSDGYHVEFECYPNEATSWAYQYVVDPKSFQVRLVSKGSSVFHN